MQPNRVSHLDPDTKRYFQVRGITPVRPIRHYFLLRELDAVKDPFDMRPELDHPRAKEAMRGKYKQGRTG